MVISYTLISTWHLIRHLGQMYLRNCWFPFGHMHNFTIVIDFFSPFRDHCQHLFFPLYLTVFLSTSVSLSHSLSPLITALRNLQLALWSILPPVGIPLISCALFLLSRGDDDHTPGLGSLHPPPWKLNYFYAHAIIPSQKYRLSL